jgi:hypothetical protein
MRSPAHSLRNGDLQTRHGLVLGVLSRSEPGFLWSSSIDALAKKPGGSGRGWECGAVRSSEEANSADYTWAKRTGSAASATAIATPITDKPPTTDASQTISRNSSRTVFHTCVLRVLSVHALSQAVY